MLPYNLSLISLLMASPFMILLFCYGLIVLASVALVPRHAHCSFLVLLCCPLKDGTWVPGKLKANNILITTSTFYPGSPEISDKCLRPVVVKTTRWWRIESVVQPGLGATRSHDYEARLETDDSFQTQRHQWRGNELCSWWKIPSPYSSVLTIVQITTTRMLPCESVFFYHSIVYRSGYLICKIESGECVTCRPAVVTWLGTSKIFFVYIYS